LARLRQSLAAGGILIAAEPQPSFFRDLVFGLNAGWFASGTPDFPIGLLRNAAEWQSALEQSGFANSQTATVSCGSDHMTLLLGEAPRPVVQEAVQAAPSGGAKRQVILVSAVPDNREGELAACVGWYLDAAASRR